MGQFLPPGPAQRPTGLAGYPPDRLERIEDLLDAILLTLSVAAAESENADIAPNWARVLQLSAHYTDTCSGELALRRAMMRARTGGFHEP